MAVTAKFQADFNSFISETQKAEAELVNLTKGTEKAAQALSAMGAKGAPTLDQLAEEKWAKSIFNTGAALDDTVATLDDMAGAGGAVSGIFDSMRAGLTTTSAPPLV